MQVGSYYPESRIIQLGNKKHWPTFYTRERSPPLWVYSIIKLKEPTHYVIEPVSSAIYSQIYQEATMLSRIIWAAYKTMYEHVSWCRLYMSCKYVYECISWCAVVRYWQYIYWSYMIYCHSKCYWCLTDTVYVHTLSVWVVLLHVMFSCKCIVMLFSKFIVKLVLGGACASRSPTILQLYII